MFGEIEALNLPEAIWLLGVIVYVATYSFLCARVLTGDSLVFFGGNILSAALVLVSNVGEFTPFSVLLHLVLMAIGFCAMLLCFFDAPVPSERG